MPIPSEEKSAFAGQKSNWAAISDSPRRSVFGNYTPAEPRDGQPNQTQSCSLPTTGQQPCGRAGLQTAIDQAMARSFIYQFLARGFEEPLQESWNWLTELKTHTALQAAVRGLSGASTNLGTSALALLKNLTSENLEPFQMAYVTAFGHAARGDCPLNEIEYGDLKADALFQPHRLADLAAFYRAFGLEVADDAAERPDHIGMELEFMAVLAAKEAYAHEQQLDNDELKLCQQAQQKFLREHLGRWALAFAGRVARAATHETIAALADFSRAFIAFDCARFGVTPGSEDLLLRPVDEAAESLCASCGLQNLPPGAHES